MPLAGEERGIAACPQSLRDGDLLERDVVLVGRRGELALCILGSGDIVSHPGAGGILAGHEAGTRRRADRTTRVTLREAHAPGGQTVDVWGLIKGAGIVGADVHEAQIVGEKEDDIGF